MISGTGQESRKTSHNPAIIYILVLLLTFVMTAGSIHSAAWAAGSDSYYFGECTEFSTCNKESSGLKDSYYFSDSWFQSDAAERNDSLALVSMQLTAASIGSSDIVADSFLEGMGFGDIAYVGTGTMDPDACNYTHASKTLADGRTLVALVIESYTEDITVKEQGWRQNFTVNGEESTSGEHYAFARAADNVIGDIMGLGGQDTVFWIMGQSRGGALTNLVAKRLGDSGRDVYAYTFESPATVDAGAAEGDYGYIHNYLCRDDMVTKVPMWGMTRYGQTYELKTEETDQNLSEELARLGSEAAGKEVPDAEGVENDLISYLESRVTTREAYSEEHTDHFTDADEGEEITLTYSYQESLGNLISLVIRGELTGAADYVMANAADALPAINNLVQAVKADGTQEAFPYYYSAAKGLHAFLDKASDTPLSLSVKDLYVVLSLIGPYAVDINYEPFGDPLQDALGYLFPAVNVVLYKDGITYSHQFDTVIARLKTLAPAPEVEDIDIQISDPEAGDLIDKAPSEVEEFFKSDEFMDAKDSPWINAEASWDTEDKELQDDCIYYLNVTLETVGHTVPEDIQIGLNGEMPVGDPVITYDEAAGITKVTFKFQIGQPPEIEVSFDTDGKTETPESITIERGTALSEADPPEIPEYAEVDGVRYKLKGWYDENGTAWEDVKATDDMTMYAKWLICIDHIDISFVVPALGDKIQEATVADDAPYKLLYPSVSNPDYDTVDEASMTGQYFLSGVIELKDPDGSVFALEEEDDTFIYSGKFTINGKEVAEPDDSEEHNYHLYYDYYSEENWIEFSYYFPVTENTPEEAEYSFTEGGGQTWTKGSGSGGFLYRQEFC